MPIRSRSLLILAALLLLAGWLQVLWAPVPEEATAVLEVLPPQAESASAGEVAVVAVVADGARVPEERLQRHGVWTVRDGRLVHRGSGEAELRVTGRRVTFELARGPVAGRVLLHGDGAHAGVGDVFDLEDAVAGREPLVIGARGGVPDAYADDGTPAEKAHRWLAVLAALGLVAAVLRPWRSARTAAWFLLGHQATIAALVWATAPLGNNNDTWGYLDSARDFLAGRPAYFPPGYSLLMAAAATAGPFVAGPLIAALQQVALLASLAGLREVAAPWLGRTASWAGLLLCGSLAPIVWLPQTTLSENVALGALAGAAWATGRAARAARGHGRWPPFAWEVLAGLLLGFGTLARVVPFVAAPLLLWFVGARRRGALRSAFATARVLAVAAGAVGAALLWTLLGSGQARLSTGTAAHLFNRVVHEQHLLAGEGPRTREFLAAAGPGLATAAHWDVSRALVAGGRSYDEAMDLLGDVAREGVLARPAEFASYTLGLTWRQYAHVDGANLAFGPGGAKVVPFDGPAVAGAAVDAAGQREGADALFARAWPWLQWLPFAGLAAAYLRRDRGRCLALALLSVPAVYLLVSSVIEYENPRFCTGVLPFAMFCVPALLRRHPPAHGARAGNGGRRIT